MIGSILADGIVLGSLLTLASLGLALAYAVFRFPNFAHGDLLTVGAYAAWAGASLGSTSPGSDGPPAWSLAVGAASACLACAAVVLLADRLVLRPLLARRRTGSVIIAAFAIGLLLRNGLVLAFGPAEVAVDRGIEMAQPLTVLPGLVLGRLTPTEQAVSLGVLPVLLLLHVWLHRTAMGRDLRALAENPDLAGLCGLVIPRLRSLAWALCGALTGLAGFALILLGPAQPGTGAEFMLPGLAVVVLGGTGSVWGILGGAVLLGVVESTIVHLGFAPWRQLAAFAVVLAVLTARPVRMAGDR